MSHGYPMHARAGAKCVMAAVTPESAENLKQILGTAYTLYWPSSVTQAQALLNHYPVDLIICGTRFDDSRLLDLLQYCKSSSRLASIPFIALRIKRGKLPIESLRDLKLASEALGASAFVHLEDWERKYGPIQAEVEFRALVASLLPDQ